MHILLLQMVQQQPAVGVVFRHVHTVLPEEVGDDLLTQQPQIAGDDEVIILRAGGGSGKVRPQGVVGGGGHGAPHVVGIGDAPVHDAAAGDVGDIGAVPLSAQNTAAGGSGRPLGGGGALAAVGDRHPVLALGGAVVGGGHGGGQPGEAPVNEQRRQRQALSHGGAGAVQPVEGDMEAPQAEGGADALVQQVPSQHVVQFTGGEATLFQRPAQDPLLHGGFSLFPCLFPKEGIGG